MMHETRRWTVRDVETPEELVRLLTEHDWTCCSGFRLGRFLWLNDATGPDGAQEYAVIDTTTGRQIESITVSWCDAGRLREIVGQIESGEFVDMGAFAPKIETGAEHGRCQHCA